jgi:hypothetical protein
MTDLRKSLWWLSLAIVLVVPAHAGIVGDIKVCYNCSNNFNSLGVLDGPTFLIENTSGTAINGISFTANGDTYNVGTIGASSNVVLEPGISNDSGVHAVGAFWHVTGVINDTSDNGPFANSTQFSLTGLQGAVAIQSNDLCTVNGALFTPLCTAGPANDATVTDMNFLGNDDSPCTNCFGPKSVANLVTVASGVPEPSTWILMGSALVAIGSIRRMKSRNAPLERGQRLL